MISACLPPVPFLTAKLAAAKIPSQRISPPLGRRSKVLSTAVCEIFDIIPMQQNLVLNGQRGDLHSRVTNCFHICLSPPSPPFPRVAKFVFKSLLHLPRCNQQPNLNIPSVSMGVKIAFVKKGQQGSPTAKYQEERNFVHIEDKYKQTNIREIIFPRIMIFPRIKLLP